MAWDLTDPDDASRLRRILLQGRDAACIAAQSFDQALTAIESAYPQLPSGAQRDRDHDRTQGDDRADDDDALYDDLSAEAPTPVGMVSAMMSEAIAALRTLHRPPVRQPAPLSFPLSTVEIKALLDKFDPEGETR